MPNPPVYESDLAYIHDQGYNAFARGIAPDLLARFRQAGLAGGRVVDLGCGSGIWAGELLAAGYQVDGVDLSPAMIEIARQRVPGARFHVDSFLTFPLPSCQTVTALGEVFCYLFDENNSFAALTELFAKVFRSLVAGGMLVFDAADTERCRGLKQAFREGPDWTCLVEYRRDESRQQLVRRIVTFRQLETLYRRHEETHIQQLYDPAAIVRALKGIGYEVEVTRSFGEYPLLDNVVGFIARKP